MRSCENTGATARHAIWKKTREIFHATQRHTVLTLTIRTVHTHCGAALFAEESTTIALAWPHHQGVESLLDLECVRVQNDARGKKT